MIKQIRPAPDLSLYYVTDDRDLTLDAIVLTALAAVSGGAGVIQLRMPSVQARVLVQYARALKAALQSSGVPLIVNDRADVAYASGADGVHLGQHDLPVEAARAMLGPNAMIGLSITHVDQMKHVHWECIDHVGVGPVLSKGVKSDAEEPMGIAGLAACVRLAQKPVLAIGGMNLAAVSPVITAGADGLAVVSAIARAGNPEAAARTLRQAIDAALEARGTLA